VVVKGLKMQFKLSKSIQVGQKIQTADGWFKVLKVTDKGVEIKTGVVPFNTTIYGWKLK